LSAPFEASGYREMRLAGPGRELMHCGIDKNLHVLRYFTRQQNG